MITNMQQMWKDLYTEFVAGKYNTRNRREMVYSRNTKNMDLPANGLPTSRESRSRKMYDDLRTKLYDRRCGFLEWNELEDNKGIDRVSQLPLSHIHLACHDLICYKLDGIKAKSDNEGEKVVMDIEFWKMLNASMREIVPENFGRILLSGSSAEGVELPLSVIDTQHTNHPDESNVIENSDKDFLYTFDDFVVDFKEDKQRKIVGIVETEKCRPRDTSDCVW